MTMPSNPTEKLRYIMSLLRSPQGCPWDQKQNAESLRPYLLEEAYEVLDALHKEDPDEIKDELGDLLLQIVFLAQIFQEKEKFDFDDIAESISQKLIRRHPHVFGDVAEKDIEKLNRQWEEIKYQEKMLRVRSALGHYQTGLPSLMSAQKISKKAARVGFDWPSVNDVIEQLEDEIRELKEALSEQNDTAIRSELGDVLFTVANIGRHLDIDCETALHESTNKFRSRFNTMESMVVQDRLNIEQINLDTLNRYWQKAKEESS